MRQTVRRSKIPWCQYQWSPVRGCCGPTGTIENPAPCSWCYARSRCLRFHVDFAPHLCPEEFPATWPREPSVVFVGPETDLWSAGVPQEWRDRVFEEIAHAEESSLSVDCIVLSKRPQHFTARDCKWFTILRHLWVGVSVTGPEDAWRFTTLCNAVPAGRRVLSVEPLLRTGTWPGWDAWPDWFIIGPKTPVRGQDAELAQVARRAIEDSARWGSAVFVKPAAARAWPGVPLVQEWPQEMYHKP